MLKLITTRDRALVCKWIDRSMRREGGQRMYCHMIGAYLDSESIRWKYCKKCEHFKEVR